MSLDRVPLAVAVVVVAIVTAVALALAGEPGAAAFAALLAIPPGLFLADARRGR